MGTKIISRKKFAFFALIIGFALITYSGGKLFFSNDAIVHGVANPVQPGDEKIDGTDFVTFDSFFLADTNDDGVSEGYRTNEIEVGKSEKLYFDIKVMGDTKLKNAKITFDNVNVKISGTVAKGSLVDSTLTSQDFREIELKEINNGLSSFFYLNVTPEVGEYISKYNAVNKVILTGTVEDTITHEEKQIRKEVDVNVNSFATKITSYISRSKDTEPKPFTVIYNIEINEVHNQMPLYMQHIHGVISDLNGVMPSEVRIYSNTGKQISTSYDPSSGSFNATMTASVENGQLKKPAYTTTEYDTRITNWHIYVEYPEETASSGAASLSIVAFSQGFGNAQYQLVMSPNNSAAYTHTFYPPVTTTSGFSDDSRQQLGAYIGNKFFVDKTLIMKSYDENIDELSTFNEYWTLDSRTDENAGGRAVYTGSSLLLNRNIISQYAPYTTVKHNSTSFIANGGKFSVYNYDTGELIAVLDKNNVGQEIDLPENVSRVQIISSHVDAYQYIRGSINFTREFDIPGIASRFQKSWLSESKNLETDFKAHQLYDDGDEGPSFVIKSDAEFDVSTSWATGSLDQSTYERTVENTSIPMTYTIQFSRKATNTRPWKDGLVVVEIPEDIIAVENLTVTTTNDVVSKEVYQENGKNFIKMNLSTNDSSLADVALSFDAVIDARSSDIHSSFILHAINRANTFYRYDGEDVLDIDGDTDTDEIINRSVENVVITAPREVITGSIIKNYDAADTVTISPLIADVNPLRGSKDADMEVLLINNSDNVIQDVEFIGKIGYIGNTYVGTNVNMGTEYNTYMAGPIVVPSALEGKVDVYYSTVENPTSDLSNTSNGWVQNPSDFTTIKSYLIKIDNSYNIAIGDNVSFTYPIELPDNTTNLNKVSYYNHRVNFKYTTDAGTYSSNVSGAKLGIRLARKYDVNINLYKIYSNTKLSEGSYLLEDNLGNTKTVTIKPNGTGTATDLYVDRVYTLKQIVSGKGNILDTEIKHFKMTNGNNDNLLLSHDGTYRSIEFDNNNSVLNIDLENEVLYKVDLLNVDVATSDPLRNSTFIITGVNHESGTSVRTDSTGHAIVEGLLIGQTYTVQQNIVNGYAPVTNFELKIVRDPVTHEIYVTAKRSPYFTIKDCDPLFNISTGEKTTDSQKYNITTTPEQNDAAETIKCKLGLDLSKFEGNYNIDGMVNFYAKTNSTKLWFRVASGFDVSSAYVVGNVSSLYNYPYFHDSTIRSFNLNEAWVDDGTGNRESVALTGGRDYDFEIAFDRADIGTSDSENDYIYANEWYESYFAITSADGQLTKSVVEQERSNVNVSNSDRVKQTLTNYELLDSRNPVLNVRVENKTLEKATFEIHKVDADTQDPLEGAQFKISGPGIINGSTYLTTDSNGIATIDLYKSYTGNLSAIPGLEEEGYPITNLYEIKEVSAPLGYSIDNRPVVFKLVYDIVDQNNITKKVKTDRSVDGEFAGVQISDNEDLFKAYMEDYPSIKIIKKDAETANLLPNTYFILNKVDDEGNLSPAVDVNGDIVGTRLLLDNQTKFVIVTDDKGEIKLNLPAGKYQLEEIIPSDEKYELTGQVFIFTVGESIPYQPEGGYMESAVSISAESTSFSQLGDIRVLPSEDGGYLVYKNDGVYDSNLSTYKFILIKYNDDDTVAWKSEVPLPRINIIYKNTYFDDPDRVVVTGTDQRGIEYNYFKVYETDDAYYLYFSEIYYYKLKKDDGTFVNKENEVQYITHYRSLCDKVDGQTYNEYIQYAADDTKYYCNSQSSYINYDRTNGYNNSNSFDVNENGAAMLYKTYSPDMYIFTTKNGDVIERLGEESMLLRFDTNGDIIRGKIITYDVIDKINEYIDNNHVPVSHITHDNTSYYFGSYGYRLSLKLLDDNSIVIVGQLSNAYTWIIHIDANDNVLSATPVSVNAVPYYIYTDYSTSHNILIDDEGNSYFKGEGNMAYFKPSTNNSYKGTIYDNSENYYEYEIGDDDEDHTGYYNIYKFNKDGKLVEATEIRGDRRIYDDYENMDTVRYSRIPTDYGDLQFSPTDGGYIVSRQLSIDWDDDYDTDYTDDQKKKYLSLELNNGTTISLDKIAKKYSSDAPTYVVYKVNYDSSIEWVRIYNGLGSNYSNGSSSSYTRVLPIVNDTFYNIKQVGTNGTFTELYSGDQVSVKNHTGSNDYVIQKYHISNAVEPETPAQYQLEIFNYLKQYDINVTSNEGGTFKITDGDNTIFEGTSPGKVETVSHGRGSAYKIKAIPNAGYLIKSIKVNGEDADYTVYDDGTVVLKKFTNVTEEKNVVVTFELGSSKVIVHHYFKDTTEQAASDELLTGLIDSDYETEPKVNSSIELAKDSNGEYIIPNNYKGQYTIAPIVVTYYYVYKPAVIQTNYLYEDSTDEIAPSDSETKKLGDEYETEPIDIPYYKVTSVRGKERGTLNQPLSQVNYYYGQITESHLHVHYIDKDTNLDIAPGYDEDLTVGGTYTAVPLANIPQYYSFDSDSGNTTGTAELEHINVYYYYTHHKSKVTTKYIDAETGDRLVPDDIQYINKGETYTTSPLLDPPAGYVLKQVPTNASDTAIDDEIVVIYYYESQKAKLITKYINAETGEKLKADTEVIKLLGNTYQTVGLDPIPDGFILDSIDGKESGTLTSDETIVTYYYITDKATLTVKYLDKRTNERIKTDDVSTIKLGDSYSTTGLNPIPEGYSLYEEPKNASGIANSKEIVVTYYYEKGSPKTNDNIIKYIAICAMSAAALAGVYLFKRNKKNK